MEKTVIITNIPAISGMFFSLLNFLYKVSILPGAMINIDISFIRNHPDLFRFQESPVIFPHDSFMERTILRCIPTWITPNQVTTVRIIGIPFVIWLIMIHAYAPGSVLFLLLAFTDAIDGSLSRTRKQITEFGKLYDPLADKLLIGAMVLLLVFQNFSFWLAITVLGVEMLFIIIALVAKIKFHTVRAANIWGKIKMISQVIAVFLTLVALMLQVPQLFTFAALTFGIAIGFAIISLFSHGI